MLADKEQTVQAMVADYLRYQYPDIPFHSDFGSGVKLTVRQACLQKRQNGGRRAWPDMFIASVRCENNSIYGGLFIELKRSGTRLTKRDGSPATNHIAEQGITLNRLNQRGYVAKFAVGFDEAKAIIDQYLSLPQVLFIEKGGKLHE